MGIQGYYEREQEIRRLLGANDSELANEAAYRVKKEHEDLVYLVNQIRGTGGISPDDERALDALRLADSLKESEQPAETTYPICGGPAHKTDPHDAPYNYQSTCKKESSGV